ncbi:MAG: hypothetical protein OJI67_01345 [Prosthecobacter sp.]|nr:hypothetical protein [Prosthecobacter sp.]
MSVVCLNLVVLRVQDMARSEEFYSLLGLSFVRHRHGAGPEHLSADLDGTIFELYPQSQDAPLSIGTRIGFCVSDVDALLATLSQWGMVVATPSHSLPGVNVLSSPILMGTKWS